MVAPVISRSPSPGPPYRCSTALSTMSSRLSVARMMKGERPKASTRRIIRAEYPPKVMRTGVFRWNRNSSTNAQLATWDSTVASAAPATPMRSVKMNRGSSRMFSTAPSSTVAMPVVEYP